MDPNANLREQEALIEAKQTRSARMRELREALWGWLRGHGFEPEWHKCPKAAKHYRSYGGSNA